jgi:thiol-disulfide isomerase/thioredoxin
MRHVRAAAVICGGLLASVGALVAAEQRPLPAFDLVSPSGAVVSSARFAADEHRVLVYVGPGCGSCDRLLASLAAWRATLPADRVAIVVVGDPAAARRDAEQRSLDAIGFAWYVDVGGAAARALGVQRLPALVGIGAGELSWSIGGVLNQPEAVEQTIRSWISQ